jgi:hypothetical protein
MGLLDNQKLQTGVATLLGVDDESDQANVIARQWASDNDYSDSEEDTLRHILLGGFMQSVEGEGLGRLGKGIAGKLINVRESTDEESLIDVDNNNFGRQLRKELINRDKDSSVEGFVEAAKNFVHNLRTEKEVRDVDGLRPRMSTAGQEKQIDMAEGGAIEETNISSQTDEAFGYAAEGKKFADDFGSVSSVTVKDAVKFVAEMTPIVGDAMAAKEVYEELQKDEPNYYLAGALGSAALIGLFPGIGDVAAKAIRKGAREVFDVVKRVEVDPNAMGSGLGNVKIKSKEEPLKERISIQPVNQSSLEARGLEYKAGV